MRSTNLGLRRTLRLPWTVSWARLVVVLALTFVIGAQSASAQERMRNSETQLLRDAANHESQGDFDGAETILRRLLDEDPGSSVGCSPSSASSVPRARWSNSSLPSTASSSTIRRR